MGKESNKKIGDAGEEDAERFVVGSGYEIITRNFRTRFGEIDIIAKDGDTLVFVEVKSKKDDFFGSPGEMITKHKLWKVKQTAQDYIRENDYDGPWRIDAVLIQKSKLEHIKNITE